jgi:CheY-like chemotaxis protein
MNKRGPIVIIEDDEDDRHLLKEAFRKLGYSNELAFFKDGDTALAYLQDDRIYPFIILSDVNMPRLNGFELRKMVHTNNGLSEKCIPYLFFSTSVSKKAVQDAYTLSVQGFFLKPTNFNELVEIVDRIVKYWMVCYSPNSYHG